MLDCLLACLLQSSHHAKYILVKGLTVVTGLETLTERLQRSSPLDTLAQCGLGIDAHHYIRQLYNRDSIKSCLSAGLGGIPTAFRSEVENDLARFAALKIGLRFVFDGLDTYNFNLKDKSKWKEDPSIQVTREAWEAWARLAEKGRYVDSKARAELAKRAHDLFDAGRFMAFTNVSHVHLERRRVLFDQNSC